MWKAPEKLVHIVLALHSSFLDIQALMGYLLQNFNIFFIIELLWTPVAIMFR